MKTLVCAALVLLPVVGGARVAAQDRNPVADALRADAARYQKNIVTAAETMAAEKFSTRPTVRQMSFAELVRHVTTSNTMLCSWIAGEQLPKTNAPAESADKNALVGALKQSFEHCGASLAKLDDSKLGEEVPFFGGRKVTRAAAILALAADWGDHYSLMATELRVAGFLPPTAKQ